MHKSLLLLFLSVFWACSEQKIDAERIKDVDYSFEKIFERNQLLNRGENDTNVTNPGGVLLKLHYEPGGGVGGGFTYSIYKECRDSAMNQMKDCFIRAYRKEAQNGRYLTRGKYGMADFHYLNGLRKLTEIIERKDLFKLPQKTSDEAFGEASFFVLQQISFNQELEIYWEPDSKQDIFWQILEIFRSLTPEMKD